MDLFDDSVSSLSSNSTSLYTNPVMHLLSTALLLGSAALQHVLGRPSSRSPSVLLRRAVDDFIETETPIALEQLLCNIGPDGCHAGGVSPGVVIASPSTQDPDYFFTWTRDSGLVFKSIVDRFTHEYDADLQQHIQDYILSQAKLQGVNNPSGGLSDGKGLGEPKFNVDLSQYSGDWGRPQRDGPALRAIAMIAYANWLVENDYNSTAHNIIWPIARNDLNYVAQYWDQTGFDLWEEVRGTSFFTIASSYRVLVEGNSLAETLGEDGDSYAKVAPQVLCSLQRFWVPSGYIDSNINVNDGRTGKDANSILGSIHTFDAELGCDAATFQPCSDRALSNLQQVVDSFAFYAINRGLPAGAPLALGRYSEDVYYSGNPWYLTTLAAAEQLYDAVYVWRQQEAVTVTDVSLAFFRGRVAGVSPGTYGSDSETYAAIVAAVSAYADGFVAIVEKYVGPNGALDEQFSRDTGAGLSARDLTWSYAAFLSATARRAGIVPPSWSGGAAPDVPASCPGASVPGRYSSVSPSPFPASQTPKTGVPSPPPTTTKKPCATATSVTVTFEELVETQWGDGVKLVGDAAALGSWEPAKGVALDAGRYTSTNPLWQARVVLKAGQVVVYKFVKVRSDGSVTWEKDPNHTYTVPRSCATTAVKSGKWQS